MKTIKLIVTEKTGSKSSHVTVDIDGSDVGMLYLKDDELKLLASVINNGCTAVDADTSFDFIDVTQHVDEYEEW